MLEENNENLQLPVNLVKGGVELEKKPRAGVNLGFAGAQFH